MTEVKNLAEADERRDFAHGHFDVLDLGDMSFGVATYEPGWRWSEEVGPLVGSDSCGLPHAGYVASGRMRIRMDDGEEAEVGPGDVFVCPPGHDAWIVGDEEFVAYDFGGRAADYATGAAARSRGSR
ncbi:cupin domain-containing protein [Streptomyces bathyalis]|uniref:Cupin domain-containing protein n=1 Tax=Streptomyces bathyalis TaxID=2710756 RepID=A0A7T1T8N0_9ACTN|nr:cupin domain-containing protein [Streptomyces bathyalis]QPP08407.1 cupin domain-containing protein [Streptomyces bathyalis]